MTRTLARLLPILLVITLGLEIGAGMYEARVLVPLWSADPQAAYRFWLAHPEYAAHAGQRWWMVMTPLNGLIGLLVFAFSWRSPQNAGWIRAAGLTAFLMMVCTLVFFVPRLLELQGARVLTMSAAEAQSRAAAWATLNWIRAAIYIAAWLAIVRGTLRA